MEDRDIRDAEARGEGKTARVMRIVAGVGFSVAFAFHLLRGRWVTAAFYLAVGFLFLKGDAIDRWPKPARYLLILVYAALAVAMLANLVFDIKANW